jgi:hypothetical protein
MALSQVCFLVAIILFILSVIPPVPIPHILQGLGLAFLAAGFLVTP